jgi:hypothetical protein
MIGRQGIVVVALIVLAVAVPATLFAVTLPAPYIWLFSTEGILFLLAAAAMRRTPRVICVNVGLIFLVLLGFEVVLILSADDEPAERFTGTYTRGYADPDHPILGYAPYPDNVATSTKHIDNEWIYSVSYTIGPDALRVTPEASEDAEGSVLFFGGSFTFGEGVEDEDTMPYRVGVLTEGSYAIHNFALHGYGPHQMLSALEHGYVRDRVDHPPHYVIYTGAAFHAERVRGMPWDQNGPRYLLGSDGSVDYQGRFSDPRGKVHEIARWLRKRIKWSALGKEILKRLAPEIRKDRDLYLAIVDASRHRVEESYAGCEFHVIFWDNMDGGDIATELEGRGLRVHRITGVIPDIHENNAQYRLHELDAHPNPEALGRIARYVVKSIVSRDGLAGESSQF